MKILAKKITYNAPKWFIKIFKEVENDENKILEILAEKTGYAKSWCEQNKKQAMKLLTEADKKEILKELEEITIKCQISKKHAWYRYHYSNWEKVKEFLGNPLIDIKYNKKNKKIIIKKNSKIINQINNIGKVVTDKLKSLLKK